LRKFALLTSVCAVLLFVFATFSQAQQVDLAGGASSLFSTKNTTASAAYPPPADQGSIYPSASFDMIFSNRYGFNVEVAALDKRGLYNGYQQYRPVFYDANVVYAPLLKGRFSLDLMAGGGVENVIYYNTFASCKFSGGCFPHVNSDHFMFHLGAGVRYRVWRSFFVRPEAHFYRIINNTIDFHSDNVFRLGASVGYTFR